MKPIQYSFFKSSKQIREMAGEDLQHSWKGAIVVNTISNILPKLIALVLSVLLFVNIYYQNWYQKWKANTWLEENMTSGQRFFKVSLSWLRGGGARVWLIVIVIALFLLYIPLKYGKERYFLLSAKNEDKVEVKEVFSGFKKYFKVLGMELQIQWVSIIAVVAWYVTLLLHAGNGMSIFTTLLMIISILFSLLGFYHGNKAKMARRIEVENPEMDSDDIFELSSKYMSGRIFSQIWLHITFIPWFLLGILTLFIFDFKISAQVQSADAFFYLDLK